MANHDEFINSGPGNQLWKIDKVDTPAGVDIGLDVGSRFMISKIPGPTEGYQLKILPNTRWNGAPPPGQANPNPIELIKVDPPQSALHFLFTVTVTGNGLAIAQLRIDPAGGTTQPNGFNVIEVRVDLLTESAGPGEGGGSAKGGRN